MKKIINWIDEYLEEVLLVGALAAMAVIMGVQVFCRYVLGASLSWSEELTRYIFIWAGFLSVSYCTKKCISIKIEQFVALFPKRGKAMFKVVNHTFELILFLYLIPFAWKYLRDTEYPEWFSCVAIDGKRVHTYKGSRWKGLFHLPRYLLKCAEICRRLE